MHGGVTSPGGAGWSFAAVQAGEPAGLYRSEARPGDGRIGWVRLGDGTVLGVAEVGGQGRAAPDMTPGIAVAGLTFETPRPVSGADDVTGP